jgi:hypothetical protein
MNIPGFHAEAALGAPTPGYRARWRPPAAGVAAAAPDCYDCSRCTVICDITGWDDPECRFCQSTCENCPRIPEPILF